MGGRWSLIMQLLQSSGFKRTEQEVIAKTKELSDGHSLKSMGSRLSHETSFQAPKAKAAVPQPVEPKAAPAGPAAAAPAAGASAASTNGAAKAAAKASATPAEWSAEQQKALEAALQRHPASMDKNERWRLIAEEVPGKTKAQCVERFKFIREQLSQQKKG